MNVEQLSSQLSSNAERIRVLVEGVPRDQACWKPESDSWSILEVVNHLYDEEIEDFPKRLDIILNQPDEIIEYEPRIFEVAEQAEIDRETDHNEATARTRLARFVDSQARRSRQPDMACISLSRLEDRNRPSATLAA